LQSLQSESEFGARDLMSALRLAIAVAGAAVTLTRHPAVRLGVSAMIANPRARGAALEATKTAAYNAGRLARVVTGRKLP
jgi:hypothetical protein